MNNTQSVKEFNTIRRNITRNHARHFFSVPVVWGIASFIPSIGMQKSVVVYSTVMAAVLLVNMSAHRTNKAIDALKIRAYEKKLSL